MHFLWFGFGQKVGAGYFVGDVADASAAPFCFFAFFFSEPSSMNPWCCEGVTPTSRDPSTPNVRFRRDPGQRTGVGCFAALNGRPFTPVDIALAASPDNGQVYLINQ